jgi:hypothetical protein
MTAPGRRLEGRPAQAVAVVVALALCVLAGCSSSTQADDGSGGSPPMANSGAGSAAPGQPRAAPVPTRWVVALGDSYVSGEGARWAANTSGRPGPVDALGRHAYLRSAASSSDCDRARVSVAALGRGPLRGVDFACSGATTSSRWEGPLFTPGVDAYSDGSGHVGQLVDLRRFASRHRVADVVVSVGGNDFGFGSLLERCTAAFVLTVTRRPAPCRDDPALRARFTAGRVDRVVGDMAASFSGIRRAMRRAGSRPSQYSVVVEGYPSPVAPGPRIRYREDLLHRLVLGGCPFFDTDATWADRVVLPTIDAAVRRAVRRSGLTDVSWLDLSGALTGHRLCEKGSAQLEETGLTSWRSPGARTRLEWVNMVYTKPAPWRIQESLHPNYWGVLAERRCVRAILGVTDGRHPRSGVCRDGRLILTP